ncbi:MAG: sugar phosphate nucleotidyltransferase [Ignavibacteriaceae bacterium]
MNFALIAAGEGQRLLSEGIDIPKPLIKVNNIPMIERLLGIISNQNPDSISIIINEKAKEVYNYLSDHFLRDKINLKVKSTESSLHSLYELKSFLQDKPFFLFTTDTIFIEKEFNCFIDFVNKSKNFDGVLGITEFIDDEKPLYVELDKENIITRFEDKRNNNYLVTGGIYYFTPVLFSEIEEAIKNNYKRLRNFLKLLIEKNYKIKGFIFSKIIDVDHSDDIKKAEKFLESEEI